MRILRRADGPVQPWKNGGGVSRLIAAAPEGAGYDALDWHVSRPTIGASGPFSHLAGLDRQFMIVGGAGVVLHCRGDGADFAQRVDRPLAPFAFRGDWDVQCELIDGTAEVFNVMTRRGRYAASIEIIALGAAPAVLRKRAGEVLLAYCPAGPVTAYGAWGTATLELDDTVIADDVGATELALAAGDATSLPVVVIRVSRT
jgi:environmental stress-induced protein Ves